MARRPDIPAFSLVRWLAVAAVVALVVIGAVLLWGNPSDPSTWVGAGFLTAGVLGICLVIV